jgi:hypothetical protein
VAKVHAANTAAFAEDFGKIARIAKLDSRFKGEALLMAVKEWMEVQERILLVSIRLVQESQNGILFQFLDHIFA